MRKEEKSFEEEAREKLEPLLDYMREKGYITQAVKVLMTKYYLDKIRRISMLDLRSFEEFKTGFYEIVTLMWDIFIKVMDTSISSEGAHEDETLDFLMDECMERLLLAFFHKIRGSD